MISVTGLSRAYLEGDGTLVPVLEGAELAVVGGEFVAVVGPSGSGKSTLLHVLGGLDSAFAGEVTVAGVRLRGLDDRRLSSFRGREVGFVFQSFHLVANLSAWENVRLSSYFSGGPAKEARRRAHQVLERVGLGGKAERTPERLSGGERQRVAIARALFSSPPLLLCDEPTGNLDAVTGGQIIDLFRQLHREGQTLLVVTHEERMSAVAQRVLRLHQGRLWPHEGPGGSP